MSERRRGEPGVEALRTGPHRAVRDRSSEPSRAGLNAHRRAGVLRRPVEFEAVLRSGVRVSSRNFVGRALRNAGEAPRLGLIAGKKAASRAVDRNRAKRLVRETFRAQASAFGPFDVTVQLRTDLRSHNNESVRSELRGLFESLARRCRSDSTAPKPVL